MADENQTQGEDQDQDENTEPEVPVAPPLTRTADFVPPSPIPDAGTPWIVGAGHVSINPAVAREEAEEAEENSDNSEQQ